MNHGIKVLVLCSYVCCVGLLGLFAIKPKLDHREEGLMTRYTSRQEAYRAAALDPDKSIQPMSRPIQRENAAHDFPWEIVFVFGLMFSAILLSSFALYRNRARVAKVEALDGETQPNESPNPYRSPTQ